MTNNEAAAATLKVWMRWETPERALASAARLAAKYGTGRFAIVMDMPQFTHPYAVVSASAVR